MRRRSGHSTRSRGKRESPSWAHCASSSAGAGTVENEMDSTKLVGVEHPGVLQGPCVGKVEPVDEDKDDVAAKDRSHDGVADVLLQLFGLLFVLLVEPDQGRDKDDEQHDDDPDAFAELHDHEDQHDAERQHGREPIDEELVSPPLLAYAQVVLGHAGARHGEAGEDTDRYTPTRTFT